MEKHHNIHLYSVYMLEKHAALSFRWHELLGPFFFQRWSMVATLCNNGWSEGWSKNTDFGSASTQSMKKSWPSQIVGGLSSFEPWITVRHGDIDHVHEIISTNGFSFLRSFWAIHCQWCKNTMSCHNVLGFTKVQKCKAKRLQQILACHTIFKESMLYLWPPCLYPFFLTFRFRSSCEFQGDTLCTSFRASKHLQRPSEATKDRKTQHEHDTLKPSSTEKDI